VRSWFFSHEKGEHFLNFYMSTSGPNRVMNQFVNDSFKQVSTLDGLKRVRAATLIVYGYQDFEPITQAHLLKENMERASVFMLNECGHLPWVEQADRFYERVTEFLQEEDQISRIKRTRALGVEDRRVDDRR
jgi:pimeloyl-ACP methyl ester carboxylesterase